MSIATIAPAWSARGDLLALLWEGGESPVEDIELCRIPLWHAVEPICLDARTLPVDAALACQTLRQNGLPVWIQHVDSQDTMARVQPLSPDAVFGTFWRSRSGTPSGCADHATLLRLLALLNADAENHELEHVLLGSPHLLFGLLRLVNSVGVGGGRLRITSIAHAITMLGRKQIQRWVMLLLYAERYDQGEMFSPLLIMTCVRARLMENLCRLAGGSLRGQSEMAFMIGMFSLLELVMGEPMEVLLGKVSLSLDGEAALLRGEGPFAPLLAVAGAAEIGDGEAVAGYAADLGISESVWAEQLWSAWCWLDRLRREG